MGKRSVTHHRASPTPIIRPVGYAIAGLICLLLFSALNTYQKHNFAVTPTNIFLGRPGFAATALLLTGFAICTSRALIAAPIATAATPPTRTGPKPYDPLLTLRAFACLMVLIGHGIGFAFRSPALIPLIVAHNPVWLLTSSPEAGVWVFFTLSGYLIGKGFFTARYTVTRSSVAHFYRNRALRILPIYWATLTIFSLLFIPAIFVPRNLPAFANMLLFNINGQLPYMPIGALWSISTELQFYAAAPMLFIVLQPLASRPRQVGFVAACLIVAAAAYRLHAFTRGGLAGWYDFAYQPLFINLDLFLAGMATSLFVARRRLQKIVIRNGLSAGAALLALLYVVNTYLRTYSVQLPEPAPGMLFAVVAPSMTAILTSLSIACFELAPTRAPGSRFYTQLHFTESIGVLTYAAYSCHEPIFLLVKNHFAAPRTILLSIALGFVLIAAVFIIAFALYNLIERHFDSLKIY
jgi:peptidoglycan/LPS O-acetylase OafA/YrhL